ncbi:phosphate ABC transporter permease subunit PstC [Sphingopyxis yananensis]|uniref:phosphate ABC transporter permease subunit PstC n=1 Tax=Sphingopyxis yananensis TaxID=2886687 RepID=UPI001D10F7B6|nr:phosphate ABC transporter permease subunit PstC [Sphingopyxis yananensis]MCC2602330.1 phosphate ABC transporter permease subunit PstC [Sphingopyxis yananensis]
MTFNAAALLLLVAGLALIGWLAGRARSVLLAHRAGNKLHSRPQYHGWYVALWLFAPAILFLTIWSAVSPALVTNTVLDSPAAQNLPQFGFERAAILADARAVAQGKQDIVRLEKSAPLVRPYVQATRQYALIGISAMFALALAGGLYAFTRIRPEFRARSRVEKIVMVALILASLVAILTTFGIVLSLLFESIRFFKLVSPSELLFGTQWNPQSGAPVKDTFGGIPLFWGTVLIGAIIAMIVAIPIGMMTAVYLTQYAKPVVRKWVKPLLEILAGVPTVVYGYFAALTVAPMLREFAVMIGISNASTESALAAGIVMGVMIIPFVSSMADDSINAVPQSMRDGSLALGATPNETIRQVLIPAALPGVMGGILLAVSRAIGETMIVVMAAGLSANLTANPFSSVTTVTAQIVKLLTGDQEFDSAKTLAAFALGLVLFTVTLLLNIVALRIVKKYREAYD